MTATPAPPKVPDVIRKRGGTPYFHNGKIYDSPPLLVRLKLWLSMAYCFVGLYIQTLFTFDSVLTARTSPFAAQNRADMHRAGRGSKNFPRPPFFPGGGSGGGGGGGGGKRPGGGGGSVGPNSAKKFGSVNDVRAPECGSCG